VQRDAGGDLGGDRTGGRRAQGERRPDQRDGGERAGQHHGGTGPGPPPSGGDGHADGHGERRHVATAELAQFESGGGAGDAGQPRGKGGGGQVQGVAHGATDHAGDQARRQAPAHQGTGGEPGEHVGGQRRHRDGVEDGQQQRRHPDLGGQGDGHRGGERARPPQAAFDGAGEQEDPGRRRHRQAEADRRHQQRIDQHQAGDGEGEDAQPARLAPEGGGQGDQAGHGRCPHHRRLEAGEEGEAHDDAQGEGQAGPPPAPPQRRSGQRQDERHVRTGDGGQVGEPGGAEVVGQLRGLLAVVAQHHPEEQRPVPDGEVGDTFLEGAAHPVGQAGHGGGFGVGDHVVDGEPSDHATGAQPGGVVRWRSLLADHSHPLAGEPINQLAGGPPVGRRLQPAAVEADVDAHAAGDRLGVAGQRDPRRHRARHHRLEAGPRPVGEGGAEQGEGHDHQPRPPDGDGRRRGRHANGQGRAAANVDRQRHHHRHQDGRPVGHGVLTAARDRASGRAWRHRCR
jgi:hypothetical protein